MINDKFLPFACLGIVILGGCAQSVSPARFVAAEPKAVCKGGHAVSDAETVTFAGCRRVNGDLTLSRLSSLKPLRELQRVDGRLTLVNNRFEALSGLEHLRRVGSIVLESNDELTDVSALGQLAEASKVVFKGNLKLASPSGLGPLSTLDELQIVDSGFLSLAGLESLRQIRRLDISGNRKLTSIRGLSHVETIDDLTLAGNGRICAQQGFFGGLAQAPHHISISHNPTVFPFETAKLESTKNLREAQSRNVANTATQFRDD